MRCVAVLPALFLLSLAGAPCVAERAADPADSILRATGVTGGFVVVLGCESAELPASLAGRAGFLVLALDKDLSRVGALRKLALEKKLAGRLTADLFKGKFLPLVDNLAKLLVLNGKYDLPKTEILRVLAPGGVAALKTAEGWSYVRKKRPGNIDDWTHFLHDPSGNAVAHDTVVGPPRHVQWVGGPRYSRHHEHMSSLQTLVTTGGRLFYVFDEGLRASIQLPPRWTLIARDAFSGVVLWKRRLPSWWPHLWPLKSGPAILTRRLVAVGDRVYLPLGLDAPLSQLDAATGKLLRTYKGTKAAQEVLCLGSMLLVVVAPSGTIDKPYRPIHTICWDETRRANRQWAWNGNERIIVALDATSGSVLWEHRAPVAPLSLAADGGKICYFNGERVVALDPAAGNIKWRSEPLRARMPIPTGYGPNMIVSGDVVVFSGGRTMYAFSARDGTLLWKAPHPPSGHHSPKDLFVIDGLVWAAPIAGGRNSGIFTGRDLKTGKVALEFPPDVRTYWFHHRCYRSKATDRYILTSRTGVEFVDFRAKHWIPNHWVRGSCVYGIMPANGLLYAPQHPCACYLESKLAGFWALSAKRSKWRELLEGQAPRLEKGPAYSKEIQEKEESQDIWWPTYRHDPERSGATGGTLSADLTTAWSADLGNGLTSITVAEGLLFVARKAAHTLYALENKTGKERWRFTTGGPIDSPPTVYRGLVLFGCADGYLYCLRASDGKLAWRFRAAPADLRTVGFEDVESVWPLHGSVLVVNDTVYAMAGRSMFLDGGLHLCRLDPVTGELKGEVVLDERDWESGKNLQAKVQILNMPPALPDILSSDGKYLYMRSQRFDLAGNRYSDPLPRDPARRATYQTGEGIHLFCPTGFLDDDWWHRSYWIYGKTFSAGCNWWFRAGHFAPTGRLLVFDSEAVYGFGRREQLYCWSSVFEYHLFAARKYVDPAAIERAFATTRRIESKRRSAIFDRTVWAGVPARELSAVLYLWSKAIPIQVRAVALAGEHLFLAGPPDVLNEEDAFRRPDDPAVKARIAAQEEALEGKRGSRLLVVEKRTGKLLAAYDIPALPVWDSMAVADGRLYLCTTDGFVRCFIPRK